MKASKLIGTILVAGMLTGCQYAGDKYSVYFDTGSDSISPAAKRQIIKAAKLAKNDKKAKIKLLGYTDSSGSKEMNWKVSKERINSVNKMLVKLGVAPMKISSVAKGEGWFEKKDKSSKKKRRVDIRVY